MSRSNIGLRVGSLGELKLSWMLKTSISSINLLLLKSTCNHQAAFQKPHPPFANQLICYVQASRHLGITFSGGTLQNNARSLG